MSRSSTSERRGQTEPIAALVAVSAVALALGVYGLGVMQVFDQDTDRDVEERALDNVWAEIRDGGVYDSDSSLEDDIDDPARALPRGYGTQIAILNFTDTGEWAVVDFVRYHPNATVASDMDDLPDDPTVADLPGNLPDETGTATRPIPIRESPGVSYTGRLNVTVWEGT